MYDTSVPQPRLPRSHGAPHTEFPHIARLASKDTSLGHARAPCAVIKAFSEPGSLAAKSATLLIRPTAKQHHLKHRSPHPADSDHLSATRQPHPYPAANGHLQLRPSFPQPPTR